jgi:hypothetical protein
MAEDCHATHAGDAHAHDDHHTAGGGPLSEIARIKASRRSFIKTKVSSPRARRSAPPAICSAPAQRKPAVSAPSNAW